MFLSQVTVVVIRQRLPNRSILNAFYCGKTERHTQLRTFLLLGSCFRPSLLEDDSNHPLKLLCFHQLDAGQLVNDGREVFRTNLVQQALGLKSSQHPHGNLLAKKNIQGNIGNIGNIGNMLRPPDTALKFIHPSGGLPCHKALQKKPQHLKLIRNLYSSEANPPP